MLAASGREAEALRAIAQFRARGGDPAWALTVEGDVKIHSGDPAGAIAADRKALSLDPNLRNASFALSEALFYLGFPPDPVATRALNSPYLDLLTGGTEAMRSRFSANPQRTWGIFDENTVVRALASSRDWAAVAHFYDERPPYRRDLCSNPPPLTPTIIVALRKSGRGGEADHLLACLQQSIRRQSAMRYRFGNDYAGSLEELQAAALALRGDAHAIDWLDRAVSLGWMGVDWSPDLHKWPEFDALWSDPRMAVVQQRINAVYARQKAQAKAIPQQS
jgi:hypothetical protein